MINQGDSINDVKTKIANALFVNGDSPPSSWSDAHSKINNAAAARGLPGIENQMGGSLARGRINSIIDAIYETGGGNFSLPANIQNVASASMVSVSMFGDSITAGSFSFPDSSDIWPPERLSRLIDESGRTITSGGNLVPDLAVGDATISAGVTYSDGEYTLTASAESTNPRFVGTHVPVSDGKLYRIELDVDNQDCVSENLAARLFGTNGGSAFTADKNFGGPLGDTLGYVRKSAVLSGSYLRTIGSIVSHVRVGAEIVGPSTSGIGRVRDFDMREATSGVAVHNQGVNGDRIAQGLSRIATVTSWAPSLCFIAFGTNDIRNGVTLSSYLSTLEDIVGQLNQAGTLSIVATLTPLANTQTNYDQVPVWNNAIRRKAAELGIGLWDRWKVLGNGNLDYIEDGRHPNAEGYDMLAQSLVPMFTS